MQGTSVGLVTYKASASLTESDSFLLEPLKRRGFSTSVVAWDAEEADWGQFESVIIRATWNYHLQPKHFLDWLSQLKTKGVAVWNPESATRWNVDKSYLLALQQRGISIIPTSILKQSTMVHLATVFEETGYPEIVVKPSIGASAHGVVRIHKNDAGKKEQLITTMLQHSDCLVQPLMNEIYSGEISLVFFGRQYSHAVLKTPVINEFRTNADYRGTERLFEPNQHIIEQAGNILETLDFDLLYARIDGIIVDGAFMLMELELIEPHLFFDLYPKASETFADRFAQLHSNHR